MLGNNSEAFNESINKNPVQSLLDALYADSSFGASGSSAREFAVLAKKL
jgi:hypothetical protein